MIEFRNYQAQFIGGASNDQTIGPSGLSSTFDNSIR